MPIYKTYTCINCNIEVTKANSKEKFCSIQCQQDHSMNERIKSLERQHMIGMLAIIILFVMLLTKK